MMTFASVPALFCPAYGLGSEPKRFPAAGGISARPRQQSDYLTVEQTDIKNG
jgi:hypothetical protein